MSAGEKECNLLTVFKPKGGHVQARDVMSRQVSIVNPSTKLRVAAQKMEEGGFGALPVVDQDRLIGMVTDRDITIRAVSKGLDPEIATVRDAMSYEVYYCHGDEDIEHVAELMARMAVRRLPVLDENKRLIGIVSLGDLSRQSIESIPETVRGFAG